MLLYMNCFQELGRESAVPLTNNVRLADRLRIQYCLRQNAKSTATDTCPFRFGLFFVMCELTMEIVCSIEVLIKFLVAIPQIPSIATNVVKITIPKNGRHFER